MADKESFESMLARLEEIVEKMESGGLELEEAMKLYDEGSRHAAKLQSMLADARDRVMKLVAGSNGELAAFESNGEMGDTDESP